MFGAPLGNKYCQRNLSGPSGRLASLRSANCDLVNFRFFRGSLCHIDSATKSSCSSAVFQKLAVGIIESSLRRFLPLHIPHFIHTRWDICNSGPRDREFESRREQGKAVFKILEEYIIPKCIHFTTKTVCNRMNLGNQQKPIKNNYNRKANEQNQLTSTKNQQTSAKQRKNREKFKAADIDQTNIPALFMNQ